MQSVIKKKPSALSADAKRLVNLAKELIQAGSRIEERRWEAHLDTLILKCLQKSQQQTLDSAIDYLIDSDPDACDVLVKTIQTHGESCLVEQNGQAHQALLIAIPVLAWTRFSIPAGPLTSKEANFLRAQLQTLLATNTQVIMAPLLLSIEQMPHTPTETYVFLHQMIEALFKHKPAVSKADFSQTLPQLADVRYLLAVAVAPADAPLFRWQMTDPADERITLLDQWKQQTRPGVLPLLPGCGLELQIPQAYYTACHEAAKQIRAISIQSAIHYLTHAFQIEPKDLKVIIGGFCEENIQDEIEEYRISFSVKSKSELFYGVIWPLYEEEEEEGGQIQPSELPVEIAEAALTAPSLKTIYSILKTRGITDIKYLPQRFLSETCEECGEQLYPDSDGEMAHIEGLPEDTSTPGYLH